ncbi:MAG TPA: PHP domain-containing protein [Candidatus Limnocylindrales bacterium]
MAAGVTAFLDLHCHTSASFDSLASPASVVRAAVARGLTHLAITDHDRIDGAVAARDLAMAEGDEVTILVGQEIRSRDGDLVGVFLQHAVPGGLSATETIIAVHEQGGLIGIPHPYDRARGSSLIRGEDRQMTLDAVAGSVDWIEAWNARIILGDGNERAAALAVEVGVPGVAVSDAHTTLEVGVAATIVTGDPSTADGLRAALSGERRLVTGHGSAYARLVTPAAKLVQRLRGNGRGQGAVPA